VGNWPIKVYLQQRFRNQRNYQHRKEVKGKGKDIAIDDWFNFGSGEDTDNAGEMGGGEGEGEGGEEF